MKGILYGLLVKLHVYEMSQRHVNKELKAKFRHLDQTSLANKGFINGFAVNDGMRVTSNPKQERQLHLDRVGSQSWHRICFILPGRCQPYYNIG